MKLRNLASLVLVLLLICAVGCDKKKDYSEEPETSAQVASRGRYIKGERLIGKATFSESPKLFSSGIEALSKSLREDPSYSKANVMLAIAVSELSKMRGFHQQQIMGVQIDLQNALNYATVATKCNPKSAMAWASLAIVSVRLSDFVTAKAALRSARKCNKSNWLYLIADGDYLFNFPYRESKVRAKKMGSAVTSFKKSIAMRNDFGLAYTRLLDVYEQLDDVKGILEIAGQLKNMGLSLPNVRAAKYRASGVKLP